MYTGYLPACKIVLKFSSRQHCSATREHGLCCHSPFGCFSPPPPLSKNCGPVDLKILLFSPQPLECWSYQNASLNLLVHISVRIKVFWICIRMTHWALLVTCISKVSLIPPKVNSKSFWTTLWGSPSELITGTIVFYIPSCPWDNVWGSYPKMERSVLAESCRVFSREVYWLHNFWALGKANQYVREGVVEVTAHLLAVKKQKLKRAFGTR